MAKANGGAARGNSGKRNLLRGHTTTLCMIVLLAIIVGLMARIAYLANADMGVLLRDGLAKEAQVMDERVNGEIARLDTISEMLAETGEFTYNGYISILQNQKVARGGYYRRMGIIAPNDMVYTTEGEPRPLEEAAAQIQATIRQHTGTYGLLSPVFIDADDGASVIVCAVNLPSGGRVPGILYAVIEMDRFVSAIMSDMSSRSICVADQVGRFIYISPTMTERTEDNADAFRRLLFQSARDNYSTKLYGDYTLTTAQLGFNGWLLAELTPAGDVWDGEIRAGVCALAGALAVLMTLIGMVSYRMLRRARGSENMVREAGVDRLTGISNMLGFAGAVRTIISRANAQKYALIVMNTDVQEVFGARYGYDAGRRILEDIARTLNAECESGETCARMDGGQFVLFMRFTDTADMLLRIKALNSHLMTLCPMRVRMHYGIYVAEESDHDVGQMIERASEAMRRVARKGDLVGLYDDALHQKQLRDATLLGRAQTALTNNEFEVRYVPVRDIVTMEIRGAEAIALWRQPDGSVLTPSEYMPLLTRNSMTRPLNMFVLERVCADLASEAEAGRVNGRVLIGMSRETLIDGMFIPRSSQIMKQYGITGARLEVLLSESMFVGDDGLIANLIEQLRTDGVRVCVSDFGSGATSLRIFGDMAVDAIRLSHDFTERACADERDRRLLTSLGQLTTSFDTQIYAAGSLTHDQLELLRKCGCTRVERIHGDESENNFCELSEIKADPAEEKKTDDLFDDWA